MVVHTSTNKFTSRSPLRYPGGKSRGIDLITAYFPKKLHTVISPFLGGGSIELSLAAESVTVIGYDVFQPLVEFWQCLLSNPIALAREVSKYYPLPKALFYSLQQEHLRLTTKLERAAAYYVLNRASYSGSTMSGGMSPGHPRFTLTAIERIQNFRNGNLVVHQADFKESLEQHKTEFAYLDPPYLVKHALYGRKGNTHREFDHASLASILYERENWIMSYNDCGEIRELYEGYPMINLHWKYGMSANKLSNELLVFSKDLAPNTV